jgi:hypothetical protein
MSPTIFSHLIFRESPESGPFVLHDPISVDENDESAVNPRQSLGAGNQS